MWSLQMLYQTLCKFLPTYYGSGHIFVLQAVSWSQNWQNAKFVCLSIFNICKFLRFVFLFCVRLFSMEAVCHLRKTLQNMPVRRSSRHSKPASNKWLDKVFTAVVFVFENWTV